MKEILNPTIGKIVLAVIIASAFFYITPIDVYVPVLCVTGPCPEKGVSDSNMFYAIKDFRYSDPVHLTNFYLIFFGELIFSYLLSGFILLFLRKIGSNVVQ